MYDLNRRGYSQYDLHKYFCLDHQIFLVSLSLLCWQIENMHFQKEFIKLIR